MAVYTQISQQELTNLLSGYNIGTLVDFTAITAGIQNSNYFIDTSSSRFVLTIYERVNHSDLPFFLNLMGHLANHNIPCPALILDKNNNGLNKIKGKPCAITSFLKGGELTTIENHHISQLGSAIAKMHLAGMSFKFQRANGLGLSGWQNLFATLQNRADEFSPGLSAEITANLDFLKQNWPENLPKGIIHADIFPDNIFFLNDNLAGIIDFYFACNDALIYDLAICLNSWCFEPNLEFNQEKANLLLASYHQIRPITNAELDALPILARGAATRFLLTRLNDWLNRPSGAIITQKDPAEYLKKLRFHNTKAPSFAL